MAFKDEHEEINCFMCPDNTKSSYDFITSYSIITEIKKMLERRINMIQLSISILIMLISPVLTLGDNAQLNPLEESSYTLLDRDHKVQIVNNASSLKLFLMKTFVTFNSLKDSAKVTKLLDQPLKNFIEYLPYDKPFLVVKKFQANYLS
jgi:hypothetical protein